MDTSETYIKMCEKAEEIQNAQPTTGEEDEWARSEWTVAEAGHKSIWLPHQDQLQAMVADDMVAIHLLERFMRLIEEFNRLPVTRLGEFVDATMEQLWLRYVMREKFGKIWNNRDWENIVE